MIQLDQLVKQKPQPNLSIIVKPIQDLPCHSFKCTCEMCHQYQANKINQIQKQRTKFIQQKIIQRINNPKPQQTPTFYLWVLNRLILPSNKICSRGIQIFVPQTCFYKDGQAYAMFLNRQLNDISLKKIMKDKLTNTVLQKYFNERRRKYREMIAKTTKKDKEVIVKKKPQFGSKKQVRVDTKDAVIVRYKDGYEQLMSQNDLINLMLKRKTDPVWRGIQYIKNYINVGNELKNQIVLKFIYKKIQYQSLFERTKVLVKIYGENIKYGDNKYISDEEQINFMNELRSKSLQIFALYMIYKIVNFIQYFYDERINKIALKLLINQLGQCFLLQVYKLQTQSLIKFSWTSQTYVKKIQQEEYKAFYSKSIDANPQMESKAKLIQDQMKSTYQYMKNMCGLSAQEPNDNEQIANNKFFSLLHPEFKQEISEVFKDKKLTVQKFKRVYLGFVPQKKPIVKPFNSNLVKTLHMMTPKLSVTKPSLEFRNIVSKRTYSTTPHTSRRRSVSYGSPSFLSVKPTDY